MYNIGDPMDYVHVHLKGEFYTFLPPVDLSQFKTQNVRFNKFYTQEFFLKDFNNTDFYNKNVVRFMECLDNINSPDINTDQVKGNHKIYTL